MRLLSTVEVSPADMTEDSGIYQEAAEKLLRHILPRVHKREQSVVFTYVDATGATQLQ